MWYHNDRYMLLCMHAKSLILLFMALRIVAHQPLCPWDSPGKNTGAPPGDLPDQGIKLTSLMSPALAGGFCTLIPPVKPHVLLYFCLNP